MMVAITIVEQVLLPVRIGLWRSGVRIRGSAETRGPGRADGHMRGGVGVAVGVGGDLQAAVDFNIRLEEAAGQRSAQGSGWEKWGLRRARG